jgi:nucleoside-diphosphate-sugar epimerase
MDMDSNQNKRHFLVIAAAARGARFFIKKALEQGHNVTGLCRADSDAVALSRLKKLLKETELTPNDGHSNVILGKLKAKNSNILDSQTYKIILDENPSIDAIVCFVGAPATLKGQYSRKLQLYTKTYRAMTDGMKISRWVETFVHGSSGSEGIPGQHKYLKLPANYKLKWLLEKIGKTPAAQNYFESEYILADAKEHGLRFILFRPAFLTSGIAKRNFMFCFDSTELNNKELPLEKTKMSISREDVAEEILRVASLAEIERKKYHGHGIYMVDMK